MPSLIIYILVTNQSLPFWAAFSFRFVRWAECTADKLLLKAAMLVLVLFYLYRKCCLPTGRYVEPEF